MGQIVWAKLITSTHTFILRRKALVKEFGESVAQLEVADVEALHAARKEFKRKFKVVFVQCRFYSTCWASRTTQKMITIKFKTQLIFE